MSTSDQERQLTIRAAEVRQKREECAEIDAQIEALGRRKQDLLKWLDAAALLAPSLFVEEPDEKGADGKRLMQHRKGRRTWLALIEEEVRNSGTGIRQRDLLESFRNGPFGSRLQASESSYYGAVSKLLKREMLVKVGDWLFTPAQHTEYLEKLARGEVEDRAEEEKFGSPSGMKIVLLVRAKPGIKSGDLVRQVRESFDKANRPSQTSVYNTVARQIDKGFIRKEGVRYFPCEENEAPTGHAVGASEADGENGPSPSSGDEKITSLFGR